MKKGLKWLIIALCVANASFAQTNRYVVHLADKEGTPFTLDNPEAFLSIRALERRASQSIAITADDLPVNPAYLAQIGSVSEEVEVYFSSRWMNNVLVQCPISAISGIEQLPFVTQVELVAPGAKLENPVNARTGAKKQKRKSNRIKSAVTDLQNEMLGIDQMHADGFTGKGISIAVMDGGFEGVPGISFFDHLFTNGQLQFTYNFVKGDHDVYQYSDHGTRVLSLMAGYGDDEFEGASYDAQYFLFVTEDVCHSCEHRIEEYNWLYAAELADSAGVDIINTSLGYSTFAEKEMSYSISDMDGETAIISRAADMAVSKGILVVVAAGNEGGNSWGYITAPADAYHVISVGGVDLQGNRSRISSHGNSADGRVKPELAAPGASVAVVSKSGSVISDSGTSYSAPITSGLAAGIWQANRDLTESELRFYLMQSASEAATPDSLLGFGIPNYAAFQNLIASQSKSTSFSLFPNPVSHGQLVIRVNDPEKTTNSQVRIFDTQGKLVMETSMDFSWQQRSHVVDMQFLDAGVYIVNLDSVSGVEKIRIVKI